MRIDILLNKLIEVSGMSKTDFAFETNYSPSAISKILNNLQLPTGTLLRNFFDLAARSLARKIYESDPTALNRIFLVSYEFSNELEMVTFLKTALRRSYLLTIRDQGEDFFSLYNSNSTWEENDILDHLCVGISFVMHDSDTDVELYSTVELFGRFENNIFQAPEI